MSRTASGRGFAAAGVVRCPGAVEELRVLLPRSRLLRAVRSLSQAAASKRMRRWALLLDRSHYGNRMMMGSPTVHLLFSDLRRFCRRTAS